MMKFVERTLAASPVRRRALALFNTLTPLFGRFRSSESGNMAIIAAITLPVTVGAVGVAVTYSSVNAVRNNMQAALDAAVLAGAIAFDTAGASDPATAANNAFAGDIDKYTSIEAKNVGATFAVADPTVSGTASGSVANPFGGLIGPKTIDVTVKAAATKLSTPICVLGLNGLENGSFDINGSKATFTATCAVQANTDSKSGMTSEGQPTAKAKKFGVFGGHKGDAFSPTPVDGSSRIADPYASTPFPSSTDCTGKYNGNGKGLDINYDTTLPPGTYCGGIHVYASAHVTLQPGVYVMSQGPFWTDGSASVTGDQVMIAMTGTGAALQIWGDSNVSLTSPTSGTYMNMQFMQDPNDANSRGLWNSIGGSSGGQGGDSAKLTFDGTAYVPTQNWWVFGNAVVNANSPSMAIVADKIWTQGSAYVSVTNQNPRNLPVPPPPQSTYGAKLIY